MSVLNNEQDCNPREIVFGIRATRTCFYTGIMNFRVVRITTHTVPLPMVTSLHPVLECFIAHLEVYIAAEYFLKAWNEMMFHINICWLMSNV